MENIQSSMLFLMLNWLKPFIITNDRPNIINRIMNDNIVIYITKLSVHNKNIDHVKTYIF